MTSQVVRKIAGDVASKSSFAGKIQLVYDVRTGEQVACFPGGNCYVREWSGFDPEHHVVFVGGNGRQPSAEYVAEVLGAHR